MKTIYLLPFFAMSSHAHQSNALFHYHLSDNLILAFAVVAIFGAIKILKRRDV